VVAALVVTLGGAARASTPGILLGADVIDYLGGDPPTCYGPSLLYDYGQPRVRALVRSQLTAMHAAGLESLRVFFTLDGDLTENPFFVSARSGRLEEPFRTNLVNYLDDVRAAGFRRVTLAFDARYSVDPAGRFGAYDPATFDETWSLIRDTRPLLKQHGPDETRVDLLNEGAPGDYLSAQVENWITRMYANYVDAFGADDVTVSAGYWPGMQRLIDALRASGKPLPRWFDLHPRWLPGDALEDLRATDAQLAANGLQQPLVIGEEKYNDSVNAEEIAEFIRTSSRRVEEVDEWPLEHGGGESAASQTRCISPPYRIEAYAKALNGSAPPNQLTVTLSDHKFSFVTPYGQPVTALEAGRYTVVVVDTSSHRRFSFAGRKTGLRYRGRAKWLVTLSPRSYVYRVSGKTPTIGTVNVLPPG
jgi:hypothetical protein